MTDLMPPEKPLVSVVTAVYNGEHFLAEAIASVAAQSYSHWEHWIVNDGSTDETAAILEGAAAAHPGRIHILQHPGGGNRGACSSRNLALRHARGRYIALLDADDVWLPHKLAEQMALARRFPQAGLIYGRSEYWYAWGGNTADIARNHIPDLAPGERLYQPPELLRQHLLRHPQWVPCPSDLLINRELLERVGGFEESFDRFQALFEDHALLAKLYLAAPIYVSSRCWDRYRIHPDSCCAVAERSGSLEVARRAYFDWLRDFLQERHVTDPTIWRLWKHQSLRYRNPVAYLLTRVVRRLGRAFGAG